MNGPIDDIVAALARGEDLGAITLAVMPQGTRETLKRCAVTPAFDSEVYERVLRPPGGPGLSELLSGGQVVRLSSGRHQVDRGIGEKLWDSWWTGIGLPPGTAPVPPKLADCTRALRDHYRRIGDRLEVLRHTLLLDPARAERLFVQLYDQAAEEFDLARCQDVINVLADPARAPLIPVELARLRDNHQLYLEARGLWATEYHQTTRYLTRPRYERPLLGLLGPGGPRVLQLHAQGGMGKTMQIRWLIARHCLTRRPPIPCARLDFDVIDAVNAIRHPWLLLVEAAHQLDQQIERSPLHELVRQFDRYRALLHHTTEPGGDLRITGAEPDEVFDRFVLAINETRRAAPVLIILDTLEEVVLKPAESAGALVELLGRLHDRVPSIRLVLAGRYDLTTRLEGFPDRFDAAPSLEITPFDDEEATAYLTQNREIGPPELVEAIVRKCDGLPFTLAVFADLVRADPTLTAADVAASTGPALLYCVVRILERIEDDRIRWILRYGVAPRALDFDFLQNVIRPFLTSAIAGDQRYDRPDRDDRPKGRPVSIFVGGRDPVPTTEQDLRALWLRLTDYAGASSWVSQEDADMLVFHPRVRGPLRELLREQPVFRPLHERAVAYYERRAAEDPERWSMWTRARLYHRFVLDGPPAIDAWRAAVAHAHACSRPDWTADLARDLFASDYLTEDDRPDPALLGHDALYEANLELARVLAEAARAYGASADSSLWSEVERLIGRAERLLSEHPELGPPNLRLQLLQASLQLARGRAETARTLLEDEPEAATTAERRDLMLLRAETHERLGDESAVSDLDLAYRMSEEIGDDESTVRIALRMAAQRLDEDLPAAALETVTAITDPGPLAGRVAAHRSWATLQLGRPGTVLARLRDEDEPWVKDVRAQALLALRTPAAAVAVLAPALAEQPGSPAYWDMATLCARAYGDQLMIDDAVRLLAPALRNEGPNQADIAVELSRLMIRAAGNLRHAEEYLRRAEREGTLTAVLVRIEWLGRAGRADEAEELLGRTLTDPLLVSARARYQISAALAGLMLGTRLATELCLPKLVEQLRRVRPVSARLYLMEDIRHCPPLDEPHPVTLNELTDLLLRSWLSEPKDDLFERDRAYLDLLAADVARVLGRDDIAGALRPKALTVLGRQDPFVHWQYLPYVSPTVREASALERRFLEATAHSPTLQGAFLVDLTDTMLGSEPVPAARDRLTRARTLLEAPGAPRIAATARLYDIRAELDNLEEQSLDRYRMAGAAATVWGGLGDEQARRRSLSRAPELASPSAMCGPTATELTLALSAPADDTMTISNGTDTFTATDQAPVGRDPEPLLDLREWQHPEAFRALARWTSGQLPGYGGARDVRLEILTPRLQAFPWELLGISWWPLALHPAVRFVTRGCSPADRTRAEITHLQRCLRRLSLLSGPVDGIVGPLTTHDVTALRQRAERATGTRPEGVSGLWRAVRAELAQLPPRRGARVLILQPDVQRSIASQRGHRGSVGDIEAIYAGEGLRPHSLQNPSATTLLSYTGLLKEPGPRRFDIVHICATMGTSGGVPHLDFYGKADIVTVTVLHAAIEQLAAGSTPPLVVLDVNAPPTSSETIRQLTLRNEFAAQLLALGGVPVILATGLAEDRATVQQRQTLARTFAGRGTAADACRSLHRLAHGIDTLHRAIPFAGSTLFSSQGPETLLPPGLL